MWSQQGRSAFMAQQRMHALLSHLFGAQARAVTFCSPSMGLSTDLRCRSCMSVKVPLSPQTAACGDAGKYVKHLDPHILLPCICRSRKTLTSNPCPARLHTQRKACRRCGKAGSICCRLASCSRLASSMFMSIRSGPRKRSSIDCAAECTGVVHIALMLHAMHCLHADQYHQTGQCGM